MSSRVSSSHRRAVVLSAAVAVPLVAAAAILVPMAANGAVDLPDKTAKELIEFAGASEVDALSGTIEQTSELGLPDLGALTGSMGGDDPSAEGGPTSADIDDLIDLATGSHTAKVYLDGDSARLQVLDTLAERNVYVDGEVVWYVDSETQTATKFVAPSDAEPERAAPATPEMTIPTPEQMLDQALAAVDETSEITVGTDGRVAGRDVYELIITPDTDDTLVGQLKFAIDGDNGAALAASVTARGATDPAFEIAFTQVDFSAPDAADFAFTPGDGITVSEQKLTLPDADGTKGAKPDSADPIVIGEGWSSVVEMPSTPGADVFAGMDADQLALLDSVTTAVDGGRALQTSLVSVLIADDGRVFAGAVPVARLVEAAQTGR